jgi:hypothetical protein
MYNYLPFKIHTCTLRTLLFVGTKFSELANCQKIANNSTRENYIWDQNFRIFRKENLKLSEHMAA